MFFLGIEKNIKVEFCYSADLYATQTCIFPLFFNFLTLKMKEMVIKGFPQQVIYWNFLRKGIVSKFHF